MGIDVVGKIALILRGVSSGNVSIDIIPSFVAPALCVPTSTVVLHLVSLV